MAELRRIGRSELFTPPLILGGNVFGWTIDERESFAVLDAFVAGGGRMIDTADVYAAFVPGKLGGESEAIIGQWLKRRGRRDDVLITTKVGMLEIDGVKGLAPAHVAKAIDASLKRLGTDYVDLYLAHQDDPDQDQGAVAEAFGALVKAGKVRATGASNFTATRLSSAIDAQERKGVARYQALQNQYNLLERGGYEGAVQDACVEQGIGMTPFYGLAGGYLTGKYRADEPPPPDSRAAHAPEVCAAYSTEQSFAKIEQLRRNAQARGGTMSEAALRFVLDTPGVDGLIVAPRRLDHFASMGLGPR